MRAWVVLLVLIQSIACFDCAVCVICKPMLLYIHTVVQQRSLLQTVIHNLVDSSEDDAERDSQRNRLQNDLDIANERLDELVQGMFQCNTQLLLIYSGTLQLFLETFMGYP